MRSQGSNNIDEFHHNHNENDDITNTTINDQNLKSTETTKNHNKKDQNHELNHKNHEIKLKSIKQRNDNKHHHHHHDNNLNIDAYCTLRSSPSSSSSSRSKLYLDTLDHNSKLDLTKFLTVNRKLKNFIKSTTTTKSPIGNINDCLTSSSSSLDNITTTAAATTTATIKSIKLPYSKLKETCEYDGCDGGSYSISSSSSSSGSTIDTTTGDCSYSDDGIINYGISKNLSTESIKNVCDCYDEISDDDIKINDKINQEHNLNNIQNKQKLNKFSSTTQAINKSLLKKINSNNNNLINIESNHNFKRSFPLRFSTLDRRKMIKPTTTTTTTSAQIIKSEHNFHPYCTIRRDKNHYNYNFNDSDNLQQKSIDNDDHYKFHSTRKLTNATVNNGKTNNNNDDDDDEITYPNGKDGSVTSAEAYNILNELDAILNDHLMQTTADSVSSSPSKTRTTTPSSTTPSSTTTTTPNCNDDCGNGGSSDSTTTTKIEDCLLELDAYLEEIDKQNDEDDNDNDNGLYDDDDTKSICTTNSLKTLPRNIRIQHFQRSKTLPKKRSIKNPNNLNDTLHISHNVEEGVSTFTRDQYFRNTIGGTSNFQLKKNDSKGSELICSKNNAKVCENGDNDNNDDDDSVNCSNKVPSSFNHSKPWRRNSMRKTSLFTLPDQKDRNSSTTTTTTDIPKYNESIEQLSRSNSQEPVDKTSPIPSTSLPLSFDMVVKQSALSSSPSLTTAQTTEDASSNNDDDNAFTNEGYQATEEFQFSQRPPNINDNVRRCLSQEDCSTSSNLANNNNNLTHLDIIHDILRNSSQDPGIQGRPRQLGRRADQHPRIVSIMAETNPLSGNQRIIVNHDRRPSSAPATAAASTAATVSASNLPHNNRATSISSPYIGSEPSSVGSSRNPSPVSLLSSTASSSMASASPDQTTQSRSRRSSPPEPTSSTSPSSNNHIHIPGRNHGINSQWPHGFSRILALLCCTLGLFNISRFSILTIHYGGNFLLQFLLLSIIFGIPMLWLQMSLGAKIKCGPVSMWKISPICKGIGISLIISQCVIALYSTISLGWIMVYFRDSFTSQNEFYLWQQPFLIYRNFNSNSSFLHNNLTETVSDYFNGIVLQRWQLGLGRRAEAGGVRFQLAFNLTIIWIAVFIVLGKGLKSFGKLVLGLTVIPLLLLIVNTCKLLYLIDFSSVQNIFLASDFEDFLINSKTWTAAAQETFFTWTLLGPSIIAISSKSAEKTESKTILRRDAILVVLITLFGLSLAAVFGFACVQILQNNDYLYFPGSYENLDSYTFLYSLHGPISPHLLSIPIKWSPHYSSVLGETYRRPPQSSANAYKESGYQALRLVTELFPSTVAVATQEQISSVWSIMTFLMFLLFGLGQLCAMWKPISSALGDSTSSVLLSCVTGLLLGIPFATEMGLSIIHYLDTVLGGAWWILILWSAQIFGVFLVRGRPYNGDDLVKDLRMSGSMSAFLALSWNVLLPVGLITLAIIEYKISLASQFFNWRLKSYFPLWTRKVAGLIQISFLMVIPITAIIQIYRYLTNGPPDILDRIQLLYRPAESSPQHRRNRSNPERPSPIQTSAVNVTLTNLDSPTSIQDDAPPKYTPPPSYTTATGARIAKLLRQSIRRSVRRILGETSHRPQIPSASNANSMDSDSSLPPEYSTVLNNPSGIIDLEIGSHTNQQSITRPSSETLSRSQRLSSINHYQSGPSYTAFDVAQILRPTSSTLQRNQHERTSSTITNALDHILRSSSLRYNHHNSLNKSQSPTDNLVLNAAPLGESNAIILDNTTESLQQQNERVTNNSEDNTSVI